MGGRCDPGGRGAGRRQRSHKAADAVPHSRRCHGRITMGEAMNLHLGWLHAIRLGYPPTVFVTVNLTCAPSSTLLDPVNRISVLRDRMKSHLKRGGLSVLVWIEVRENPGGKSEHVHWAIWVPPHLTPAFKGAMRGWVAMDADQMLIGAVDFRRVYDWVGLQQYLLKAGTEEVRQKFSVPEKFSKFQGKIEGPRVRVSHAIGAKARRDSEWPLSALVAGVVP